MHYNETVRNYDARFNVTLESSSAGVKSKLASSHRKLVYESSWTGWLSSVELVLTTASLVDS